MRAGCQLIGCKWPDMLSYGSARRGSTWTEKRLTSVQALQTFDARRVGGLGLNRRNQAGSPELDGHGPRGQRRCCSDEVAFEIAALAFTIVFEIAASVADVAGIDMHVVHGFRSALG